MWQNRQLSYSEAKMRAIKFRLAAGGLICLLVFLTGTATARVYVNVGLGTSFGHHHSRHYGRGYGYGYPRHGWYGGYRGYHSPWWGYSYWPSHHRYSSGSSFWIHQSYPIALAPALKMAKAKDPDRGVRQAAYRSIIMIEGY